MLPVVDQFIVPLLSMIRLSCRILESPPPLIFKIDPATILVVPEPRKIPDVQFNVVPEFN